MGKCMKQKHNGGINRLQLDHRCRNGNACMHCQIYEWKRPWLLLIRRRAGGRARTWRAPSCLVAQVGHRRRPWPLCQSVRGASPYRHNGLSQNCYGYHHGSGDKDTISYTKAFHEINKRLTYTLIREYRSTNISNNNKFHHYTNNCHDNNNDMDTNNTDEVKLRISDAN